MPSPPLSPSPAGRARGNAQQGAPPCAPTPLSHSAQRGRFFAGVPARGVAEQGIFTAMRARRSRSQHARRWERGRPARNANCARKKPTPLSSRSVGEELQGAPPCAPTPLSHSVGEGLGVRAKKVRLFRHSVTPTLVSSNVPGEGEKSASVPHAANSGAVPLSALSGTLLWRLCDGDTN